MKFHRLNTLLEQHPDFARFFFLLVILLIAQQLAWEGVPVGILLATVAGCGMLIGYRSGMHRADQLAQESEA